jgi:putative transcriptional regulator
MNLLQQHRESFNYDFPLIANLTLAQEIIRARKKMNISQQQLASKLGISPRTLESWERGVRHPSSSAQALIKLFIKSPQFVLDNLN